MGATNSYSKRHLIDKNVIKFQTIKNDFELEAKVIKWQKFWIKSYHEINGE
jgi:hypothetical protein